MQPSRFTVPAATLAAVLGAWCTAAPAPPTRWPRERATLAAHQGPIGGLAFSPDGKTLASAGYWDGTVRLWDVTTGKKIATFKHRKAPTRTRDATLLAVAFSPDGKTVASCGEDSVIKLWEASTGKNTATLKGHRGQVSSIAFSSSGKVLASTGRDRTVRFWDVATAKVRKVAENCCIDGLSPTVGYSPSETPLVAGVVNIGEKSIALWNAGPEKPPVVCKGHRSLVVHRVVFSRDGKTMASMAGGAGPRSETVRLWDVATGRNTATITLKEPYTGPIRSLALSSDGKLLALGYGWSGGVIRLYEVSSGRILDTRSDLPFVDHLAFGPDGRLLAAGCGGDIKLWNLPARWKAAR